MVSVSLMMAPEVSRKRRWMVSGVAVAGPAPVGWRERRNADRSPVASAPERFEIQGSQLARLTVFRGGQTGSQRRQPSGDTGRRPATISAANWPFRRHQATSRDRKIAPSSEGPQVRTLLGPPGQTSGWRGQTRRLTTTVDHSPVMIRCLRNFLSLWQLFSTKGCI